MKVTTRLSLGLTSFALVVTTFGFTAAVGAEGVPAERPQTVEALVGEVLQQHPELEFYRAEVAAARAGRKAAGQWRNPELSAEVGNKRVWDRADNRVLGDGVAWSVSLAQPIEFPGRIGLRKAIANRQIELAELGLAQFQSLLAGRVRSLALETFAAQQRLGAAREVATR